MCVYYLGSVQQNNNVNTIEYFILNCAENKKKGKTTNQTFGERNNNNNNNIINRYGKNRGVFSGAKSNKHNKQTKKTAEEK